MVRVFDGWDSTDITKLLAEASGNKKPKKKTSTGNRMLVTFKSDHADERKGFRADWEAGEYGYLNSSMVIN